jgi:hypothetical protein
MAASERAGIEVPDADPAALDRVSPGLARAQYGPGRAAADPGLAPLEPPPSCLEGVI